MKLLKYIVLLTISVQLLSCSDDDNTEDFLPINEIEDLIKIQEISNELHSIELYSKTGNLIQGYNDITLRIKEIETNKYIENVSITWMPVMNMMNMSHSSPRSMISKVEGKQTLYNGYIVFQMAENENEGWTLKFNYSINGASYELTDSINVSPSEKRTTNVFVGSDGQKYVLSLIEPFQPEVKVNTISMALYKMESMMNFPVVTGYTIKLDPRMPSMENHTSPNNEDLIYDPASKLYKGKLSLTMTGLWNLNLMLMNAQGEVLKGEEITAENLKSSLYMELEF